VTEQRQDRLAFYRMELAGLKPLISWKVSKELALRRSFR
jgi:hypothetical protein